MPPELRVAVEPRFRLHSGGVNWMASRRQSEGATTLEWSSEEATNMTRKQTTKTARKPRESTTRTDARTTTATPRTTGERDPRLPPVGTTITRRYKGRDLRLTVLDEGFRFEGEVYRSLTATALKATGYPAISGPHFWRLTAPAAATPKRKTKKGATNTVRADAATQPETAATV